MRTTSASISSALRGRPGFRLPLPSYFWAISFRCQASSVSGVVNRGHFLEKLSSQSLGLGGQATTLVVSKPQAAIPELLTQHSILLLEAIDRLQLALVRSEKSGMNLIPCTSRLLIIRAKPKIRCAFSWIQFFGPYARGRLTGGLFFRSNAGKGSSDTPAHDALVLSFCLFPPPTYRLLTGVFARRRIASASPTACLLYSSSARYLPDSS